MIFNIMNKILKKPQKNPNKQKTQRFFPIRRLFKLVSTTRQTKKNPILYDLAHVPTNSTRNISPCVLFIQSFKSQNIYDVGNFTKKNVY